MTEQLKAGDYIGVYIDTVLIHTGRGQFSI